MRKLKEISFSGKIIAINYYLGVTGNSWLASVGSMLQIPMLHAFGRWTFSME